MDTKFIRQKNKTMIKCPLCQSGELDHLFLAKDYISSESFNVYKCSRCDLAITETKSTNKNISEYYGRGYYGQRKFLVESAINFMRVRTVSNFKGFGLSPSLIDVGCGNGVFLRSLRERGWKSFGTEIAPPDHFKDDLIKFIYKGDFMESNFRENSFDVVTMWHSLEHLPEPLQYFAESKRVLKQNGILLVEVPNFKSWQAKIFKENWFHLDVPRHLFHFSPKSIRILFKKAGLKEIVVKRGSLIYGYFGCLQSILNVLSARKNLFFDFLNKKISLSYIYKNHRKDFFINIVLFIPTLFLSAVLFLAELAMGRSGIILVSARK